MSVEHIGSILSSLYPKSLTEAELEEIRDYLQMAKKIKYSVLTVRLCQYLERVLAELERLRAEQ